MSLKTVKALAEAGLIADEPGIAQVVSRYALSITDEMTALIEHPDDPIGRQFIPSADELRDGPEEHADPIGDAAHSPCEGVVHRYPDRVLLKLVSICPVYCRFCFRREAVGPGKSETLSADALDRALEYIAADPKIWEVILTGGDPLMLSPRRIRAVTERLASIPHVKILRWHSRIPVVDPTHVTDELVRALKAEDVTTYIVLHSNHVRELTTAARAAIARLIDAGIPMLSQSVLLRGVNDDAETLEALMRALVELRIKPYYLHHADRAKGTAHLRTTIAEGQALMKDLRARASGLCQPIYVLDIPGGHGKVPVGPRYLSDCRRGSYSVTDEGGHLHEYSDVISDAQSPG
jgi:lysine 2,3-aminomutase